MVPEQEVQTNIRREEGNLTRKKIRAKQIITDSINVQAVSRDFADMLQYRETTRLVQNGRATDISRPAFRHAKTAVHPHTCDSAVLPHT